MSPRLPPREWLVEAASFLGDGDVEWRTPTTRQDALDLMQAIYQREACLVALEGVAAAR
ncbi:MAG: hypothetical protein ACLGIR_05985 [Actinomycetes bacterium]